MFKSLPKLEGSEKQVKWAESIRNNIIEEALDHINCPKPAFSEEKKQEFEGKLKKALEYLIYTKTRADFYIDNQVYFRLGADRYLLEKVYPMIPEDFSLNEDEDEKVENEKVEDEKVEDEKVEDIVFPAQQQEKAIAEIKIKENKITVSYPKNERFRKVVKELGYTWDGIQWVKECHSETNPVAERAAELGNQLLNAGIPIAIKDPAIRQKAISGDFTPECTRWIYLITGGQHAGKLLIKWRGNNNKLYNKGRTLPSAKWVGGFAVRIEYHEEVEDFAALYGFQFTKAAKKAIEEFKQLKESVAVVTPAKVEKEEPDGLKDILTSSTSVLEDLKDE